MTSRTTDVVRRSLFGAGDMDRPESTPAPSRKRSTRQSREPTRGGKFDGERNPVQPTTDVRDNLHMAVGQFKKRQDCASSIDEQADRCRAFNLPRWQLRCRHQERRDPPDYLPADTESLARCGQNAQIWAPPQVCLNEGRTSVDQVLTVIDRKKNMFTVDRVDDRGKQGPAGLFADTERHRDRGRD